MYAGVKQLRIVLLVAQLLSPGAVRASGCDEALIDLRLPRASQQTKTASNGDSCRASTAQFIQAVTARQAVSACPDGETRRRALEMLDVEIERFNNQIADQSCGG